MSLCLLRCPVRSSAPAHQIRACRWPHSPGLRHTPMMEPRAGLRKGGLTSDASAARAKQKSREISLILKEPATNVSGIQVLSGR